jgi:hypothetical protein
MIFAVSAIVETKSESAWRLSARYSEVDLVFRSPHLFLNFLDTKPDID